MASKDFATKINPDITVASDDIIDTQAAESSTFLMLTKATTRFALQEGDESDLSDADAVEGKFYIVGDSDGTLTGDGTTPGTQATVTDTTSYPVATEATNTEKVTVDGGAEQTATFTTDIDVGTITDTTTYPLTTQDGLTSLITLDGGSAQTITFTDAIDRGAVLDTTSYPVANQDTKTEKVTVDGGSEQTVTFAGATTTAAHVQTQMAAQLTGCTVTVEGGQVRIISDTTGASSTVTIGTGTTALTWAAPGDINDEVGIASEIDDQLVGGTATTAGGQVVVTSDTVSATSAVAAAAGTGGLTWAAETKINYAAGIASQLSAQITGATAAVVGGQVVITSLGYGTLSTVAIGTGTATLTWDTPVAGAGGTGPYILYSDAVTANIGYVGKKRYIRPVVVNPASDVTIVNVRGDLHKSPDPA